MAFLASIRVTGQLLLESFGWLQCLKLFEQALIVGADLPLDRIIELECGSEVEQVLVSPRASEVSGDLVDGLFAARIAMGRQTSRVAFAINDGANDRDTGLAREFSNGAMHLHVHLVERFLHPLHVTRALLDEIGELPLQGADLCNRFTRTK